MLVKCIYHGYWLVNWETQQVNSKKVGNVLNSYLKTVIWLSIPYTIQGMIRIEH